MVKRNKNKSKGEEFSLNLIKNRINSAIAEKGLLVVLSALMIAYLAFAAVRPLGILAAPQDISNAIQEYKGYGEAVLAPIFSATFGTYQLATRSLFGILLFMILYSIIAVIFKPEGKGITKKAFTIAITLIITLLALWGIPPDFITSIRATYGAMGAAILSIIPFAIMFVFTMRLQSRVSARILWIFFVLYYFGLYVYNAGTNPDGLVSWGNIPNLLAAIAGIIIFIFIGAFRNFLFKEELKQIADAGKQTVERAKLLRELQKNELNAYDETKTTTP